MEKLPDRAAAKLREASSTSKPNIIATSEYNGNLLNQEKGMGLETTHEDVEVPASLN